MPSQKKQRLEFQKAYDTKKLNTELPSQKEQRLESKKSYATKKRSTESPSQRAKRLKYHDDYDTKRFNEESPSQRNQRLEKMRNYKATTRSSKSPTNKTNFSKHARSKSDSINNSKKSHVDSIRNTTTMNRPTKISVNCGSKICEWVSDDVLCGTRLPTESTILKDFEQDPRIAVLVYHIQSGLLHEYESSFDSLKIFDDDSIDNDEKELFVNTEDEQKHITEAIKRFNECIGQEHDYVGCAGCGQIYRMRECKEICLSDNRVDHLIVSREFSSFWEDLSEVSKAAYHVLKFENKVYAVAPSLIHPNKHSGYFCKGCQQQDCGTCHSRFLDFDYGVSYLNNKVFQNNIPEHIKGKELTVFNRLALQRSIQYTVHVKISATTGNASSTKMKSHSFCVPHDGADVLAETIVLNEKCLDAFTMTFIGDAELFHLMKTENKITEHTVNAELSYHILYYLKGAGHPLYKEIEMPSLEEFTRHINSLSKKALDNVIIGSDALPQIWEMRMENKESGSSGLFTTYGDSSSNKECLQGIAHMISKGTIQDE